MAKYWTPVGTINSLAPVEPETRVQKVRRERRFAKAIKNQKRNDFNDLVVYREACENYMDQQKSFESAKIVTVIGKGKDKKTTVEIKRPHSNPPSFAKNLRKAQKDAENLKKMKRNVG